MQVNDKKLCCSGRCAYSNEHISPQGTNKKTLSIAVTALLFSILATPATAQDIWVSGYYPAMEKAVMPPESVNYNAMTHIILFGVQPGEVAGTLDDWYKVNGTFSTTTINLAHSAGKKVLLCVGGALTKDFFVRNLNTSQLQTTLVNNIANLVTTYNYDGVDIDWEPFSSTADGAKFTSFITELHDKLNQINPSLLLTTATSDEYSDPGIRTINANLQDKFDQINLMSYDITYNYPGWATWHSSPLYNGNYTFPDDTRKLPSIDEWVQNYIDAGVEPSKIGIGIAFHGQIWSGGSGTSTGGATMPQQSWTTAPTIATDQSYRDIMNTYYTTSRYYYDDVAESPYLSIDNSGSTSDKFISYENETSIAAKFNYIRNRNIGGAIIWHLAQDYYDANNQPLKACVANNLAASPGPSVNFTSSSQSVAESVGSVTVTAQLSAINDYDVTVPYSVGGTATKGGVDHNLADSSITIKAGDTTGSVTFSVINDTLDEPNETVIVSMGTPTNVNKGATSVHTVTIMDDDEPPLPTVKFSLASQSVAESIGTVTVSAQVSAATGNAVTVPFTVSGTATGGGTDYILSSSSIIIPAGQTSGKVTFIVSNDTRDEDNETVVFTMGAPVNATKGATTVHTLTITDNDNPPTVNFSASTQSKAENAGTATVTAKLSAASGKTITVPFAINTSSTAKAPDDYTISASPITIPAGNTSGTATITIANDTLDEARETVIVDMVTPVNATRGATSKHTLTITDDDAAPTVTFSSSGQTVAESGITASISASLSAVSGLKVTVPFAIVNGSTATNGIDYKLSATSIVIPVGQQTGSVTFTPIKDTIAEGNETVILAVGTPTNASKGTTNLTHTVTITNN